MGEQESSAVGATGGGPPRLGIAQSPRQPMSQAELGIQHREAGLGEAWRDLGSWIRGLGENGPPASLAMAKCGGQSAAACGATL